MEEEGFKTLDGVKEAFADHFLTARKYHYTGDVLDHVIEDIYNNARLNGDLPPVEELPADLEPHDDFGVFEPEADENEAERMRYAGAVKVVYGEPGGDL